MIRKLRRDACQYADFGGWYRNLGFWVVASYRLGAWARGLSLPVVRVPLVALAWALKQPMRLALHVELPFAARIGAGLALIHPYNVLVGRGVEIGEDCALYHEVTIGAGPRPGFPRLGNRIVVFAGARVLGGISVQDGCEIGANCVVTRDVPPGSVVIATPHRVLAKGLSRPSEGTREEGT